MSASDMRETLAIMRQIERQRWALPSAQPDMTGTYQPPALMPDGPIDSRVVSPSTPPSQVRHTTPSPPASDAETAEARQQSLAAQQASAGGPDDAQMAERRRQMELLRQALAEYAPRLGILDEND